MSEPVRIDGMPGYETRIDADQRQGQYPGHPGAMAALRRPGLLRIIGSAPRDQWEKAFPRFRAVRDGVEPR